ncbi:COG1361 family protein [Nocardia suismassiliense]|uniref:hypothetical protein n=1 Tax=Nocardia suismassiliense TaxID=2077092 RepID=UPI001F19C73D|nr:hypothetical protein [Nocardia suismassiliense]
MSSDGSKVELRLCLQTDGLSMDLTTARADCSHNGTAFSSCRVEGNYTLHRDGDQIAYPGLYSSVYYPGPGTYEVRWKSLYVTMHRADALGQYREGFTLDSPLDPLSFELTMERTKLPAGTSRIQYLTTTEPGPARVRLTLTNDGEGAARDAKIYVQLYDNSEPPNQDYIILSAPFTTDEKCLAQEDNQDRPLALAECEIGDLAPGQSVDIVLDVPLSMLTSRYNLNWNHGDVTRNDLGYGGHRLAPPGT